MSEVQTQITCLCDEVFPVHYEDELDIAHAENRKMILDGQYLSFTCPACKKAIKIEPRVRLFDGNDCWEVFPETERDHFLAGALELSRDLHRVVFGYKEMAEKVRILGDRLDDRPLEVLKFTFLEKQGWPEGVFLTYHETREGKIYFYIEGLKENEVGVTAVPQLFYERIQSQVGSPPPEWADVLSGPYVNVQKLGSQ